MNLVTCEWLHKQITTEQNSKVLVLDTSWGYDGPNYKVEQYDREHIPGAIYFQITKDTTPTQNIPFNTPSAKDFQAHVREVGVNEDTHVVICEKTSRPYPLSAVRCWVLFKLFGHDLVSVLDGGVGGWTKCGYSVTDIVPKCKPGNFLAKKGDYSRIKSYKEMQGIVQQQVSKTNIVDVRLADVFSGESKEPNIYIQMALKSCGFPVEGAKFHSGHLPGAVNVSHLEFLDMEAEPGRPKFRNESEWATAFEKHGVDLSKPVVFTCHLGLTACTAALVADHLGCKDWSIYIGSWTEWGQNAPSEMCETS